MDDKVNGEQNNAINEFQREQKIVNENEISWLNKNIMNLLVPEARKYVDIGFTTEGIYGKTADGKIEPLKSIERVEGTKHNMNVHRNKEWRRKNY